MDVNIIKPCSHKNLIGKEQEIVDLYYNQLAPMSYIADIYQCSCDILTKWFRKNGLKTRTIQESSISKGKFRATNDAVFGDFKFTHPKLLGKDEEIRKLYIDEKYGVFEICKLYEVQSATIRTWLKRNGIPIRTPKEARNAERRYEKQKLQVRREISDEETEQICKLYNEGYGAKYIAKLLNCDSCVIFRILKERGIHIRNKKEALETDKRLELYMNTILKKYGNYDSINMKRHITMLEKYGGYEKQSINRTTAMLEKYGVDNPMHVHEYFLKNQHSGLKFKTFLIDGVEVEYQGYELSGIYKLLSEGYSIEDIKIGRSDVPSFRYFFDGRWRVYYPDIFIPKDNRIVEIKSKWTYEKELEKNLAKQRAVLDLGYRFDFFILER